MCRPGDAMCGVNKAEMGGCRSSRQVARGGRGGGDRVGKKRASKRGTDSRDKHQITTRSSVQVWTIREEVGGRRGYLRLEEDINAE